MNKETFLTQLRCGLVGLPREDIEERLAFYSEMIDDRIEEGLSEEEAIFAAGEAEKIIAQIIAETPLAKIAKERIKAKRKLKAWEMILLILGSPLWLSLLIAAFAVVLSVYLSLWAVLISFWAVFGSFAGSAFGGVLGGAILACSGRLYSGIILMAGGLVCAGLAIFAFFGCKAATKGLLLLTKKFGIWIKNCFIKKEELE